MREFKKLPLELFIGYDIEQNSRVIELDASEMVEKYPSGILQLVCKRPGEETTYIAPSFEQDGGTLRWTLTSYDVEKAGQGLAIVALVDTSEESVKVLASHKIRTGIEEGLHFRDAETVDPEDSLIARVLAAVSQAQAYAQDAKEEADRAEAAGDAVEDAKDQAIADIEAKGQETLVSIPSDYTALSGDVSDLKSNISQKVDAGYVENGVAHFTGDGNELFTMTGVGGEGLSADAKNALLACFRNVAWIGNDGQMYYDALEEALNYSRSVTSISAVFDQGSAVIYDTAELNDLRQYLTVTATYDDGSTKEISNYVLSGTLTAGTSTITAAYNGKTTAFNVTVTHRPATLQSISAAYNQGSNVVYDDATLDSLRQYLTVTAHYSDSTSATVTEYTLGGTLTAGTSTITATYEGKTATFNVTVAHKEATLQSISTAFNQGSAVIYDDATLDSLKQYLTVTAHYSDGTTAVVSEYTLSGTLTAGTSAITATYNNKTATFNVKVTQASSPTMIYTLPSATTFNGTEDYIDTGLQLLTNTKSNFTIAYDAICKPQAGSNTSQRVIFHCMHEISPYPGFAIQYEYSGTNRSIRKISISINSSKTNYFAIDKQFDATTDVREKMVVVVDFQKGVVNCYANIAGIDYKLERSFNKSDYDSLDIAETALIGCYQNTSGVKGRYFTGTIYDFKIYDHVLTDTEAQAYLQEDHS